MSVRCKRKSSKKCPMKAFEEAKVSVPVTFRAYCETEEAEVECVGRPYVIRNCHETPGRPDAVSRYTVVQKLRAEIPMEFYAESEVGEAFVEYSSSEESCDCD